VSFATITLYVASQQVFVIVSVYFVMAQSGNFWIHPMSVNTVFESIIVVFIIARFSAAPCTLLKFDESSARVRRNLSQSARKKRRKESLRERKD
jgi:hypothetical protein